MQRRALVCGVTGQDGALLASLLLQKGYEVWGSSRLQDGVELSNLRILDIERDIQLVSMLPEELESVRGVLNSCRPDEIYYLAGQSSVGRSFDIPAATFRGISLGTLNMLEAVRSFHSPVRLFNAGSGECFGDTGDVPADETTRLNPTSPYAVAKVSAYWLARNYRENFGLYVSTGLLFNHESPLRPERFVTQKIIRAARRISQGSKETLSLGRLDIWRDWGWASEYVEAMWLALQASEAEDYVIATGQTCALRDFVAESFAFHGLDWREHVKESPELYRPSDIVYSRADPGKAATQLGWKARSHMADVVRMMSEALADGT